MTRDSRKTNQVGLGISQWVFQEQQIDTHTDTPARGRVRASSKTLQSDNCSSKNNC